MIIFGKFFCHQTCHNDCYILCVYYKAGDKDAVRGFVQVEWNHTDSMAFTLNVNEKDLGVWWSGNIRLQYYVLL